MSKSTWQTASRCRYREEEPIVLNRRSHDSLHEAGMKFEAWMFLEYCRQWPSRIVQPEANEWIGMNLLYRDTELTDDTFRSHYYTSEP